jgi:hypothetical protein
MKKIVMVFAEKCDKCKSMKQAINSGIKHFELTDKVEFSAYNSNSEEAIDVAIENSISEIPGCVIGGTVIEGENFNPQEILDALEKMSV